MTRMTFVIFMLMTTTLVAQAREIILNSRDGVWAAPAVPSGEGRDAHYFRERYGDEGSNVERTQGHKPPLDTPNYLAAQKAQAIVTIQLEIKRMQDLEGEIKSFSKEELQKRFSKKNEGTLKEYRAAALDEIRSTRVSLSETLADIQSKRIKNPSAYFHFQPRISQFGTPFYYKLGATSGIASTLVGLAGLAHAKEESEAQTAVTNLDSYRASRFKAPATAGK